VSWLLTIAGFAALIVLHELGHFSAAKAVGMRVERFSLFFPPHVLKLRRGETEYALGVIPAGGYVKITGMNPREELPREVAARAYFRQPVWKRIVVILAGPVMNVLVAFLIVWALFMAHGVLGPPTNRVSGDLLRPPASGALRPGDRIVSVDGRRGGPAVIRAQVARHRCPGPQVDGCSAATPAHVVVRRDGRYLAFDLRPRYRASERRALLGFTFVPSLVREPPARAAALSAGFLWYVTSRTVSAMVRIFEPAERKKLSGVVGTSQYLHQQFSFDLARAMLLLAIISMSLAIVNLFPFLPLDGGHIFWAVAEKLRGRAIPFEVMERSMAIGFVLVLTLFVIGLTNDIGRLQGHGLRPR
jgi:regulator of sigma E protease